VSGRAGQNPGHAHDGPPAGYTWADRIEALVASHGTLTQVAWKLIERSDATEDVASVERALRRLRTRGQLHPFASYRRDAGLACGLHRIGRTDEALACAARACEHAGDGGYTRLRVMGLLLQLLGRVARAQAAPAPRAKAGARP
jgi:hypothetical protein